MTRMNEIRKGYIYQGKFKVAPVKEILKVAGKKKVEGKSVLLERC